MIRSLRRLVSQTPVTLTETSVFSYLRKTGAELTEANRPADLESLVRLVSAIDSFKYPAFKSVIGEVVNNDSDAAWLTKLTHEAEGISQANALKYFRVLAPAEVPSELLLTLLRRMTIQSRQDISDFIAAVSQLSPSQLTKEVRSATTFVVKNAAVNNCRLGVYNDIFDLVNKTWRTTRRHLIPTKLRSDLVEAAWGAFLRLDMGGRDPEFVEAIRWLSQGESSSGRKDEIEEMYAKIEARAKSFLKHDLLAKMLKSILGYRNHVVPEPLDSVAQLLVRKMRFSRLSVSELEDLVSGLSVYLETRRKAPQLEALVSSMLPRLVSTLSRNMSTIPSRSLPAVLGLLARSGDHSLVLDEIERRGHEMNATELVKLVNSLEWTDKSILSRLFSAQLSESKYVDVLLASLTLEDKVQLLATLGSDDPSLTLLTSNLVESITGSIGESIPDFDTETVVKMVVAGDELFAPTGLDPSKLLMTLLESDESGLLSLSQTLRLMRVSRSDEISSSLFRHAESFEMDADEATEFLRSTNQVEGALKKLVPLIQGIEHVDQLLTLIPSNLLVLAGSQYAPTSQLRDELRTRLSRSVPWMDLKALTTSLEQLARLSSVVASEGIADSIVTRLVEISNSRIATGSAHAVSLINSARQLGVYNGEFLDLLVRDFASSPSVAVELIEALTSSLTAMGNRNESVLSMAEQALKKSENMSVRISLLNSLARNGVFSPLFAEQFRIVVDEASKDVSALSDADWVRLFETHLVVLLESPPKIKLRFANDMKLKSFVDDNCAFSWYACQEKLRNDFIYSSERAELSEAMESLGWTNMRVPELGKEVYHVDFVSDDKVAIVTIPECDELRSDGSVRIIVGDSMTKIKHLQLFGYKVVPVWIKEWNTMTSQEERKRCLLRNSNQVVYALGTTKSNRK